jgi:hypothetical protein
MAADSYVLYRKACNDLEEVEISLNNILTNPYSYKLVTTEARRCLMKEFPYVIYYVLDRNMIVVLRVRGKLQRP